MKPENIDFVDMENGKSSVYVHMGSAGRTEFDVEAVKATKKSEFVAAHSHIPGADELWHTITGKAKAEKKEPDGK